MSTRRRAGRNSTLAMPVLTRNPIGPTVLMWRRAASLSANGKSVGNGMMGDIDRDGWRYRLLDYFE